MMSNVSSENFTEATQENPIVTSKERRKAEYDKRKFIETHSGDLRKIVQTLTNLADQIPDISKQIEMFTALLPTNRIVVNGTIPDSIKNELEKLTFVADTIAAKLPGQNIEAEINRVKTSIVGLISNIPE